MEENEDDYSPYCSDCTACGEDGCCSHTMCLGFQSFSSGCKYGRTYLIEAINNKLLIKLIYRLMDRMKNKEGYSNEDFVNDFDRFSERILRNR